MHEEIAHAEAREVLASAVVASAESPVVVSLPSPPSGALPSGRRTRAIGCVLPFAASPGR